MLHSASLQHKPQQRQKQRTPLTVSANRHVLCTLKERLTRWHQPYGSNDESKPKQTGVVITVEMLLEAFVLCVVQHVPTGCYRKMNTDHAMLSLHRLQAITERGTHWDCHTCIHTVSIQHHQCWMYQNDTNLEWLANRSMCWTGWELASIHCMYYLDR